MAPHAGGSGAALERSATLKPTHVTMGRSGWDSKTPREVVVDDATKWLFEYGQDIARLILTHICHGHSAALSRSGAAPTTSTVQLQTPEGHKVAAQGTAADVGRNREEDRRVGKDNMCSRCSRERQAGVS